MAQGNGEVGFVWPGGTGGQRSLGCYGGLGRASAYMRRRPLVGVLSFADGCSMLGIGMAPLFAGLGLCYQAPGGVAAPPGVTSLSPAREGLRRVYRRARQGKQRRLRARWCLRDMLASPEEIASCQNVRTHAGRSTLRPDPCPTCREIVVYPPHDSCRELSEALRWRAPGHRGALWPSVAAARCWRPRKRCRLASEMAGGALSRRCRGAVCRPPAWT